MQEHGLCQGPGVPPPRGCTPGPAGGALAGLGRGRYVGQMLS